MNKQKTYTPILFSLVGCITGITMQAHFAMSLLILIIGVIFTSYILYNHDAIPLITKSYNPLLFFFAGALIYQLQIDHYYLTRSIIKNKEITATGTITDKQDWNNDWKKGESIHVKSLQYYDHKTETHHKLTFSVLCYLHRKTSLQVGDTVALKNITITAKKQTSFSGNPTYDDYLRKQNIMGSLFVKRSQITLRSRPKKSLWRWLHNKREAVYSRLKKKLTSLSSSFFGLIFLGNKQTDNQDHLRTIFNFWGLDHYLARSGLHIVLFIIILSFFLQLLPLHLTLKRLLIVLICLIYTLLSWSSLSFVRALLVFLFMKLGEFLFRPTNFLHLLTLCCLVILLYNPTFLFFLDFQLTFGLTFALIFFSDIIRH